MKSLITGGAGFIGANFVRYMLNKYGQMELVVLDKLTYAGNLENLRDVLKDIEFIEGDICDKNHVERAIKDCSYVFNFAAETHVDRSIVNAATFVRTDVLGTYTLLETSKENNIDKYIQISTDEVYGSLKAGSFKETDALHPSNPYSASKAGGDLLVLSYCITYGLSGIITRSSNNYGPYQHPEKLIPHFITNATMNLPLPLYGDGKNVRDWIYVGDNCRGIDCAFTKGEPGEIYNIGGNNERTNLEISKIVLELLHKPSSLITFVSDRPGHDYRYSLDCSKITSLGWRPFVKFEDGISKTVNWYEEHKSWWRQLI
ncbi:MAG TPA: dTDP-glucose 4,6-dehydratase [Candidatus Acidoferrum sp.]|nr:dTDP-glucose 4,6-dehydratase [Candidatus Acidoferrum sp.]